VKVAVGGSGVRVNVGVIEGVMVGERVGSMAGAAVRLIIRNTDATLTNTNKTSNPITAGNPRVISGIRVPWTALDFREGLSSEVMDSSVPQTKQRVASKLSRVPQVGHNFEGEVDGSGLIILIYRPWRLYQRLEFLQTPQFIRR
jgi:hypothetical protein